MFLESDVAKNAAFRQPLEESYHALIQLLTLNLGFACAGT
jgi:hypothetical protein